VATGASVAIVLHTLVMLRFSSRIQHGLVGAVLRAYAKSLPLAAATAAVCWPLATWLRASTTAPAFARLLLTAATALLIAGLVLLAMRKLFAEELAVLAQFRLRRQSPSPAVATAPGG
jgi:PST family polysaccharide transporter